MMPLTPPPPFNFGEATLLNKPRFANKDPQEVVDAMVHALTSSFPKIRFCSCVVRVTACLLSVFKRELSFHADTPLGAMRQFYGCQ